MVRTRKAFAGLGAALTVGLLACSSDAPVNGTLVIGLTGDELRTTFDTVKVVAKVNGQVAKEQDVRRDGNGVIPFPAEVPLEAAPGAKVEVDVTGLTNGAELLKRRAVTVMPSEKRLLRLTLDGACVTFGGVSVTCGDRLTCQRGQCVSEDVPLGGLEAYEPKWPVNAPDVCRGANAGAPELLLGKGQTEYGPLADNEVLRLERGPQGGHHIWVAVRMKNLKQSGSRTAITAVQPETGMKAAPAAYVFTFDPDEGGYCKLYGLRYQIDAGGALGQAHKPYLGKDLDVTVEVTDVAGNTAKATKRIRIGDKLLCPDGTEKCNE